jgi:hypothetical protein
MKIRNGFVSNSSSASFIVPKKNLTDFQLSIARNIYRILEELDSSEFTDHWEISEDDENISYSTYMDNDNLEEKLNQLGIETISGDNY